MFDIVTKWVRLFRDIGILLGFPTLIYIGMQLHETEVSALKAQIEYLKNLQYDKAVSIIRAKDQATDIEKEQLQKSIKMLGGGTLDFDDFTSKYMCLRLKNDVH
ncbi:MAG: hypothetical protein GYB21_01420 [Oceanospirillales bacterium]|jgi:hypothetical protein|nr:hypothetical protein [Oceanospirillales bacterium]